MPAPAGALPVFPHYRSSDCSPWALPVFSPLPQQCLLQQERFLFSPMPQQACSRKERKYISPLPPAVPAPRRSLSHYFPTAEAVSAPAGALIYISPLPQQCPFQQEPSIISPLREQYLPSHPPSSPHTATPAHVQQKPLSPPRCRSILQALSSIPSALKPCNFLGGR